MTKKELNEMLAPWPDDAVIEVAVRPEEEGDFVWYELINVEKPYSYGGNEHCLIFAGRVMMG